MIQTAPSSTERKSVIPGFRRNQMWTYFGPAFVASVAYIDPGNFATNILGGTQFGYRLLWVLLWSNAMAILIQYLSAKLGIVTGLTLPQNCRKHFARPTTITLWLAAEVAAIATDLAEFLGAAMGLDLLFGPYFYAHGWTHQATLLLAALVSTVLVFAILALDLAGHLWLERGIIGSTDHPPATSTTPSTPPSACLARPSCRTSSTSTPHSSNRASRSSPATPNQRSKPRITPPYQASTGHLAAFGAPSSAHSFASSSSTSSSP